MIIIAVRGGSVGLLAEGVDGSGGDNDSAHTHIHTGIEGARQASESSSAITVSTEHCTLKHSKNQFDVASTCIKKDDRSSITITRNEFHVHWSAQTTK